MVGGTTSGYSLIGRRNMAINPTRKITAESTPAKMGRRMKKWEKFIRLMGWCSTLGDLDRRNPGHLFLRRHGHAGPDSLHSIDNDFVARQQAGANNALAIHGRAEFHRRV